MQGSDGERKSNARQGSTPFSVDRRSYLKLTGVAAGSAALLSGPASAAVTRRGLRFQRVVNMVEDAGCDPTGTDPCDDQITDAADDYTLLKFPPGEYKLTEKNVVLGATNVGFLGDSDVRFTVPERFNQKALVVDDGTGLLFEGIDIDQTADGATPALHLGADDDLRVHDVELIGQGIHPDSIPKGQPGYSPGEGGDRGNPDVMDFFYPIVRSPDGTGLVTDLVANNHGLMGTYNAGDGRSGIWVGVENQGTLTFRDCRIEEFGSNGTYTSRTYGVVQFEGGVYRNNDNNQIRIGAPGSYIDGAVLDVDADASEAPNPYEALNYRGVRIEMGRQSDRTDVAVRNSDIAIRSASHSGGGVVAEATASEFSVENTRIGVDVDGVHGILGKVPDGGGAYDPPAKPHAGTVLGTSITGSAADNAAIKLIERSDSVVDGCCIQQEDPDRDGVHLLNSDSTTVKNSTIDVTGEQVIEEDCWAATSDIADSGSCPVPTVGAGSLPRTLSFESDGGRYSYTFSVSGDLDKSTARDATIDRNDSISGNTATGQGGDGGIDSYGFSGNVLAFGMSGDATVYLDDETVDPAQFPDNTLSIVSNGGRYSYAFAVGGELEKSTAMDASVDDNDIVSGSMATGQGGGGGVDSYEFSGDIRAFGLDGDATIYLNGDPIDASQYPDVHTLTIEGTGSEATYTFSTSGDLAKSTVNGANINTNDEISGQTASGVVGISTDSYAFLGDLTSFALDGEAAVSLDGEPAHVGQLPDHVLTIEGTGSRATYTFSVSDDLTKSTANGANINTNDEIVGSTASGVVGVSTDSYTFSGSLESFALDGDAAVFLDGEPARVGQLPDHVLTIEGTGSRATYEFSVSGDLVKSTANGANINTNDEIAGSSASGVVGISADSYVFSGGLNSVSLDGDASVFLDGERITV